MAERRVAPLAPRRKELPCSFTVPASARNRSLLSAVVLVAIGVVVVYGAFTSEKADGWERLLMGLLGVLMIGGSWMLAMMGFAAVRLTEDGMRFGTFRGVREIAWDDIGRISFGATKKRRGAGGGGITGAAVRALVNYMDDEREQDPYFVGRVRQGYEPSAHVCDHRGKIVASFADTLGWGFFMALYAEADARGIGIVRTS
jgi:hypothetical protein